MCQFVTYPVGGVAKMTRRTDRLSFFKRQHRTDYDQVDVPQMHGFLYLYYNGLPKV